MSPTTPAPTRSLVQRMEALQNANEIRSKRAVVKRDLKAGHASIVELLLDPPRFMYTAKVFDLMLAVPKYGRVKVNRVLNHSRISPSKTVGGLSVRQRSELARVFGASPGRIAAAVVILVEETAADEGELSRFHRAVLWHANDLGDASPEYAGEIASRIGTSINGVSQARAALQRLGLLDVASSPTERGRDALRATEHADSGHAVALAA